MFVFYINKMFIRWNKAKILRSASCLLIPFIAIKPFNLKTWLLYSLSRKIHKTDSLQISHIISFNWQSQVLWKKKKKAITKTSIIGDIPDAIGGLGMKSLHPPAAILPVPGTASIHMPASSMAWHSQRRCEELLSVSYIFFLHIAGRWLYLFDFCYVSWFLPLPFYLATASYLGILISLSASPDECALGGWFQVISWRFSGNNV